MCLPVANTTAAATAAGTVVAVTKLNAVMPAAQRTCPHGDPSLCSRLTAHRTEDQG